MVYPNNGASEFYISKIGDKLQAVTQFADQTAGEDNWRFCWKAGSETVSFLGMCSLYEASYDNYFTEHSGDMATIATYKDVYDNSPTNVDAGTSLDKVLSGASIHLQDVVVRRLLQRYDIQFSATNPELLQIRSTSESDLGRQLSPLNVPFTNPAIICEDNPFVKLTGKMQPGSVEHFYHANRRLEISGLASSEVFCQGFQAQFGETIQLEPVPVTVRD